MPCAPLNKELLENCDNLVKPRNIPKNITQNGKIITRVYQQKSKEKMSIELHLLEFANKRGTILYAEYRFHPVRRWRFDWCIPDLKLAIEYNGIISKKSRHTTIGGYSEDMNKINEAIKYGWKVLQYTPLNYGNIVNDLDTMNFF